MRSAEKKKTIRSMRFCTGERSDSFDGDDSRSLSLLSVLRRKCKGMKSKSAEWTMLSEGSQ